MDAMLGGDGSDAPVERELTMLERSLAAQMVEVLSDLTDAWPASKLPGQASSRCASLVVGSAVASHGRCGDQTSVADALKGMRIGLPRDPKVLIRR